MVVGYLSTLLATFVAAQSVVLSQFCGVNNEADPAAIQTCQAQDAINVESDKNGTTLRKRAGTTPFLTLAAGAAVNSIFALKNNAGNECLIIANDTGKLYRSINSGSAVEFSTITSGARLYCQSDNGRAYCFTSSNDTPFSYDCQTYLAEQQGNGYPNGKFNTFTQDRQLIAGTTDFPNRLYVSQAGGVATFTVGVDVEDPWFEDIGRAGDKITGVYFLNGRVIVFKEYSIGGFNVTDQFNSIYYDISNRVGIVGPESALVHDGLLYFKGSDNEFYRMDGSPGAVEKLSTPIKRIVSNVLTGKTRYVILTDQADWDSGNYNVRGTLAAMSGSIVAGAVMPSSITRVDSSTTSFASGSSGYIVTSSAVTGGGLFSLGLLNTWTSTGAWETQSAFATDSSCIGSTSVYRVTGTSYTASGGSIRVTIQNAETDADLYVNISSGANPSPPGCPAFTFDLSTQSVNMEVRVLDNFSGHTATSPAFHQSQLPGGKFTYAYYETSLVGQPTQFTSLMEMPYPFFLRTSTFTSQCFDTGFSTPTFGGFSASMSSSTRFGITYQTLVSTDCSGVFDSAQTATIGEKIASGQKRYIKYNAIFTTDIATFTGHHFSSTLPASTTGQYITSCIEPGTGISAWGTLELGGVFTGGGTNFTIEDSTGTSCTDAGLGNTWTTTSTGTTISIATAAAYKARVTFNIGSASDTARMDNLTVNWTEGTVAPPSYVAYWDDGIYFAISTGTTGNNRLVKYDLRNGALWPFDLGMNSPVTFNNIMYFGSTSTAKVLKYSANNPDQAPTSDDGTAINAYWRSKAMSGPDPFSEKVLDRISVIARKESAGTLTTTWRLNNNTNTNSFTVQLSTGQTFVRHNYKVPVGQVGAAYDVQVGNNSVYPFEVLGIRLDLIPRDWRPLP